MTLTLSALQQSAGKKPYRGQVLAIDPGSEQSAYVIYDAENSHVVQFDKVDNENLLNDLRWPLLRWDACAIEMIASYGMPVGREVFETCVWIGRFYEAIHRRNITPALVYRRDVKLHLCGSVRANDSHIRQALIDMFGPGKDIAIGKKKTPGPLYGLSADRWAALAVAVYFAAKGEA